MKKKLYKIIMLLVTGVVITTPISTLQISANDTMTDINEASQNETDLSGENEIILNDETQVEEQEITDIGIQTAPEITISQLFEDIFIQEEIANVLGKTVNENVTQEELDSILSLNVVDRNKIVSSLEGVQLLTNLTKLGIYYSKVQDLSPIADLVNLEEVAISYNQYGAKLQNINSISNLKKLENIYFTSQAIEDISALQFLPELKIVVFDNADDSNDEEKNLISNIDALSNLEKLESVHFDGSFITSLDSLNNSASTLKDIGCRGCSNLENINAISNFTNLTALWVRGTKIQSIPDLSSLTKLRTIDFSNNKDLIDIQGLSGLRPFSLKLDLLNKEVFGDFEIINNLNFYNNSGAQLSLVHNDLNENDLAKLNTSAKYLDLKENSIQNLEVLKQMLENYTKVEMSDQIVRLSDLSNPKFPLVVANPFKNIDGSIVKLNDSRYDSLSNTLVINNKTDSIYVPTEKINSNLNNTIYTFSGKLKQNFIDDSSNVEVVFTAKDIRLALDYVYAGLHTDDVIKKLSQPELTIDGEVIDSNLINVSHSIEPILGTYEVTFEYSGHIKTVSATVFTGLVEIIVDDIVLTQEEANTFTKEELITLANPQVYVAGELIEYPGPINSWFTFIDYNKPIPVDNNYIGQFEWLGYYGFNNISVIGTVENYQIYTQIDSITLTPEEASILTSDQLLYLFGATIYSNGAPATNLEGRYLEGWHPFTGLASEQILAGSYQATIIGRNDSGEPWEYKQVEINISGGYNIRTLYDTIVLSPEEASILTSEEIIIRTNARIYEGGAFSNNLEGRYLEGWHPFTGLTSEQILPGSYQATIIGRTSDGDVWEYKSITIKIITNYNIRTLYEELTFTSQEAANLTSDELLIISGAVIYEGNAPAIDLEGRYLEGWHPFTGLASEQILPGSYQATIIGRTSDGDVWEYKSITINIIN